MIEQALLYLSISIRGVPVAGDIKACLSRIISESKIDLLDKHVLAPNKSAMTHWFEDATGESLTGLSQKERSVILRFWDFKWLMRSNKVLVVVESASTGVGMELQRALDREDLPPILAICSRNAYPTLSAMVEGVEQDNFELLIFDSLEDLEAPVREFLSS